MRHVFALAALLLAGCQDCNLRGCVGSLELQFLDASGAQLSEFSGAVSWDEDDGAGGTTTVSYAFACGGAEDTVDEPVKCTEGGVRVGRAPDTVNVTVETTDGLAFSGDVVPESTQTPDEMTCGTCDGSEAAVTLE